ncbi:hypothetical protein RDI58_023716 [Solanum bulbocastanum]|uniref:peptidylprolyl isomerase n=1 Tax=Solanum bulbocastanum TaxID=147425 RepID=A0AAN8SWX4_SOLBU
MDDASVICLINNNNNYASVPNCHLLYPTCNLYLVYANSFEGSEHYKIAVPKSSDERMPSLNVKKLLRRSVLQFVGLSPIFISIRPVLSAPMQEMREPDVIRTLKLDSGVRLQDVIEGEGPEAREGDIVEINYVCRRSNGYFVHSTVDQFSGESAPVILPLDDKQVMVFASFGLKIEILKVRQQPSDFHLEDNRRSEGSPYWNEARRKAKSSDTTFCWIHQ